MEKVTIFKIMQSLREQGYAVVLASPEQLNGVNPFQAQDAAWAAIDKAIERQRIKTRRAQSDRRLPNA